MADVKDIRNGVRKKASEVKKAFGWTSDKNLGLLVFGWSSLLCATTAIGNAEFAACFFALLAVGALLYLTVD